MTVYALNGLGRIGKLALKPLLERGAKIAFLNDAVGDPAMHAHLLEFDTVHGRWDAQFESDSDSITINGTRIPAYQETRLEELPLEALLVIVDKIGTSDALALFRLSKKLHGRLSVEGSFWRMLCFKETFNDYSALKVHFAIMF